MERSKEVVYTLLFTPIRKIKELPIFVFYSYLWKNRQSLLMQTIAYNYVMPLVLELLPWFFSRRRVGNRLRRAKINLNNHMLTGGAFRKSLMKRFVLNGVFYAVLTSLNSLVTDSIEKYTSFEVKRMVLQKILFSELRSIDHIGVEDLDEKIAKDIEATLNLFNRYFPALFTGIGAFLIEASDLLSRRERIHKWAILYPILLKIIQYGLKWLAKTYHEKTQKKKERKMEAVDVYLNHAIEGIIDIQLNNGQLRYLEKYDQIVDDSLQTQRPFIWNILFSTISNFKNMNFFAYGIEVVFIHKIMDAQNINYRQHIKLQEEINNVIDLGADLLTNVKKIFKGFNKHDKIKRLMDIPNFEDNTGNIDLANSNLFSSLVEIKMSNLVFYYQPDRPPGFFLENEEITFLPGMVYGITGQNKSGKSSVAALLCKLYDPQSGVISLNGIDYKHIPRTPVREFISYLPQESYMFAGTIRDNILLGNNANVTEIEILKAAERAGVISFILKGETIWTNEESLAYTQLRTRSETKRRGRKSKTPRGSKEKTELARTISYDELAGIQSSTSFQDLNLEYSTSFQQDETTDDSDEAPVLSELEKRKRAKKERIDHNNVYQRDENGAYEILNHMIAYRGADLSPGLAQAIALARIYVRKNAKVIILDEALTQLDPVLRNKVLKSLVSHIRKNNMALILITHNTGLLRFVDYIYVMDKCTVVHQGDHQTLMEEGCELYTSLLHPEEMN